MKDEPKKKTGRPPSNKRTRDLQMCFFLTPEDAAFCADVAQDLGFKSRSEMITAIIERLVIGGFSGIAFAKVGFQFCNLISQAERQKKGFQGRLDFLGALRPFPPLIGDEDDPTGAEIVPFLEGIKTQIKKGKAA